MLNPIETLLTNIQGVNMKKTLLGLALALTLPSFALAEETMTEKAKDVASEVKQDAKKAGRSMKRTAKKGMHRVEEAVCMEGDLKCAAKKAGNRVEEATDATVDAMKNAKDKTNP